MRNGNQLFSAIQFLLTLIFFFAGAALFGLHFLHGVRLELANWILQGHDRFLVLGFLVTGTACLLGVCFYAMQRHQFLRVEMGGNSYSLDAEVVKARLEKLWEEEFTPQSVDVHFAKEKIEVITQGALEDLEKIEERLKALFSEEFGYEKEFYVTLN